MFKYVAIFVVLVEIGFSYGVRPAFSLGVDWSYMKPEDFSGSHFLGPQISITAPFSRYIGIHAGLLWADFDLSEEAIILGLNSRIGFIEMIPNETASPYFTQHIILD